MADELSRIRSALTDRYAVEREVGRGGMATVFLAEDLKHRRTVAIKVLHPDIAASLGRERFLREIEIVANLRHRGILPLYDSGEADGLLYYVMPYVEGPTLRDRLDKEKQLGVEEALRITAELAAALDEAHSHGVIHRDIKPENVLFEGDQPLIADFGVARALEEAGGEKLTRTGVAVGTPAYMSPEQAAGGEADARSDEYALACVLYEMLGGTAPFTGPSAQAVMARHALDSVPDLTTVRSTVPEGVIAAVEKAMAKVPADRYPSAGAFAEALAKGDEKRIGPVVPGRRWKEIGIAVVLVLTALGVYLAARGGGSAAGDSREYPKVAVLPFDVSAAELAQPAEAVALFADVTERLRQSGIRTVWPRALHHYTNSETAVDEVYEDLHPDVVWVTQLDTRGDSLYARADLVDPESRVTLGATLMVLPVDALKELVPLLYTWAAGVLGVEEVAPAYEPDPEARRKFAKARTAWWNNQFEVADALLDTVVELDPGYADAWGLKALLDAQFLHGNWAPPCSVTAMILPYVKQEAARALRYDSSAVLPHVALGHALWEHEFDWETGESEFLAALERAPDHPDANLYYGIYLMTAGQKEEAWTHWQRSLESNVLETKYQHYVARLATFVDRLPEAERLLRRARDHFGPEPWITLQLAGNLGDQGRLDEAIELLLEAGRDTVAEPLDDNVFWAIRRGSREAVDRHLANAEREGKYRWASLIANAVGRYDEAMGYLERWWPEELACPSGARIWLLADYPELVDRPRFQEMMDVAGIPWRESAVWKERSD